MDDNQSTCSKLSWSSQLTQCESFEKNLAKTWTNVKVQKKIMELVISIRNTITRNGGTETSTEFYAALIALMKNTEPEIVTLEACGYMMKALLSSDIPAAVLRYTTSDLCKIVSDALTGVHGKNENVTRFGLLCLSKVLKVQSEENWRLDNVKHMYRMLFAYTSDSRPKVSAFALEGVMRIFQSKTKSDSKLAQKHPLNKETLAILTSNIRQQNNTHAKKNDHKNLRVKPSAEDDKLSFALTTLCELLLGNFLSEESIVSYVETLIQCLLSMQIVPIQCQILSIFERLFQKSILSPEITARCLTCLFSYISNCTSTASTSSITIAPPTFIGKSWLNTTIFGFESLLINEQSTFIESNSNGTVRNCREIALIHAGSLIRICSDWLLCDDEDMKSSANKILRRLCSGELIATKKVSDCLDPDVHADADNWLVKWTEILGRHLSTQHELMWAEILDNVTLLVRRSNSGKCHRFIDNVVQVLPKMAELRDSYEDNEAEIITALTSTNFRNARSNLSTTEKKLKHSIEALIGQLMCTTGVDRILSVLPLTNILSHDDDSQRDLSNRTWIVPLMSNYVQKSSPEVFRVHLLPFVELLTTKIDKINSGLSMETGMENVAIASLGTLRYQIWSCLPSFGKNVAAGGLGCLSLATWEMLLDMIDPRTTSNLETIALTTIRNLAKSEENRDEAQRVLTAAPIFPRALQHMFARYSMPGAESDALRANIKCTLDVYLGLFAPETFDANIDFLLTRKLSTVDREKPSEDNLRCVELLVILGPHLTVQKMAEAELFLEQWLDNENTDGKLQKRVYRFLETVTASDTTTSNEYTKENLRRLVARLADWRRVKNDSWKCRMKTIYNLLKLMTEEADIRAYLNAMIGEIVTCLAMKSGGRVSAVAGLVLVEAVLGSGGDGEAPIDGVLRWVLGALRDTSEPSAATGTMFKQGLSKALSLLLCEQRLSQGVTAEHVESALSVVKELVANGGDMELVRVGLDMVQGLFKGRCQNYSRVRLVDVGACLRAAGDAGVLKKVRTKVRAVLRRMLRWWSYEEVKATMPEELVPVLRNLHKQENRANRTTKAVTKDGDDSKSTGTSWAALSEAGTMRNPNIRGIVDILEDSDSEDARTNGDHGDLESKLSGVSLSAKSVASNVTRATELRKMRKRKVAEANATLFLEENDGDIVDISDPVMLARHIRVSTKDQSGAAKAVEMASMNAAAVKKDKTVDKRGFKIQGGRLLIGNTEAGEEAAAVAVTKSDGGEEEEEEIDDYKSKKDRFQPPKKRAKTVKLLGAEYKSFKKGVFGDMKKKDRPEPYAYVPLKDNFSGVMKKYEKEARKCLKATRQMSKMRKRRN